MNLLSVFTIFRRFLFSRRANAVIRRVSVICLLGLMVSIGSLVIVFNVMGGLGRSIKEGFLKSEPHIIINFKEQFSQKKAKAEKKNIKNILVAKGLYEGVEDFYFFETVDLVVQSQEGRFLGAQARGYESEKLYKVLAPLLLEDLPPPTKIKPTEKQKFINIGFNLARELKVYEGETLNLMPAENLLLPPGEALPFQQAILENIVLAENESWSQAIFYDKNHFPNFSKNSSYAYGFELLLKNPDDYLLYKEALKSPDFLVSSWPERNSSVFFALKVEKLIMSCFLSLAGLITMMAVSSLLVLMMVQKQKEMGILRAIGLSPEKLKSVFVGVGFLLCVLGAFGGWLLALLICLFLKYQPLPFLSQVYEGALFPIEFNWQALFVILAGALGLAFLSCYFSVHSQIRKNTVELLKSMKT